jgi:hypothetical protein
MRPVIIVGLIVLFLLVYVLTLYLNDFYHEWRQRQMDAQSRRVREQQHK